uniref:Uncharacterized protein n=1 Tax=Picea glauca TaxID=3330 RepID=A0A101M4L4_PICGL|nr:hypothetical protein ABT39_MTgene832 [Picea glauca]
MGKVKRRYAIFIYYIYWIIVPLAYYSPSLPFEGFHTTCQNYPISSHGLFPIGDYSLGDYYLTRTSST